MSQWYRFNEAGYMVAGWYLDIDGNWYFLHNVSDGTQGHMYTGWHQIEVSGITSVKMQAVRRLPGREWDHTGRLHCRRQRRMDPVA